MDIVGIDAKVHFHAEYMQLSHVQVQRNAPMKNATSVYLDVYFGQIMNIAKAVPSKRKDRLITKSKTQRSVHWNGSTVHVLKLNPTSKATSYKV